MTTSEIQNRCHILLSLIGLKRRGVINGVWCPDIEGDRVKIQAGTHLFDDTATGSRWLTWKQAAAFVGEKERKPARSEQTTAVRKAKR